MNIIIAGCGKVGFALAEQLDREGHEVTVIDNRIKAVQAITGSCDVIGYVGECTSYHTLVEAGIKNADLLIAVTDKDETNMLTCLIGRKAGKCQTIARVRTPQYYEEIKFIKEELGLSMSVNPEIAAAQEIVRLIQIPSALMVDTFAKGRTSLVSAVIPEKSILNNMPVRDLYSKVGIGALICIVERGKDVIIPDGNFVLKSGDKMSFTISMGDVGKFLDKVGIKRRTMRNILIAGGGTEAYYLTEKLLKLKKNVKIIEKSKERCDELSDMFPKALVINGDPTDKKLLMEESFEDVDAVCSLTQSDEENIMISLFASKMTKAKIFTGIHRNSYEDLITDLPLGNTISKKKITSEYILKYVRTMQNSIGNSGVETLYRMMDDRVEALEFIINENSKVTNTSLMDMKIIPNTLICSIFRKGKVIRPGGKDEILPGDSVVVVTTKKGLNNIDDILRG